MRKGIEQYQAPELLRHGTVTTAVDIWSMGCILYEIAIGKPAFHDDFAIVEYYLQQSPLNIDFDNRFDEKDKIIISEAISRMLEIDSSKRPPASTLSREFHKYHATCAHRQNSEPLNIRLGSQRIQEVPSENHEQQVEGNVSLLFVAHGSVWFAVRQEGSGVCARGSFLKPANTVNSQRTESHNRSSGQTRMSNIRINK
jgi:serine/threonine protein kinase